MSELSPAAQAVAKAALYVSSCDPEEYPHQAQEIAAAALRAAADQMRYEDRLGWTGYGYYTHFQNQIRAIASELEAQ